MKTTGRTRTWLRATVLWSVLSVAVALLGADRALAAAMEVDARSVHRAVWKVYGGGKSGTAFAIGERHFLTCAHVIKGFADHEATEVFINRHGSEDSRRLRVNYGHVAVALAQDIALFTTRETVDHYFTLAETSATEGETGLRAMGHPARATDGDSAPDRSHHLPERLSPGGSGRQDYAWRPQRFTGLPGLRQGGGDALPGQRQHERCGHGRASSPLHRRRPALDRLQGPSVGGGLCGAGDDADPRVGRSG